MQILKKTWQPKLSCHRNVNVDLSHDDFKMFPDIFFYKKSLSLVHIS